MDYAVQPLIFFPRDRPEEPLFAEGAVICLRMAREWFARELNGKTFGLVDAVSIRSRFTERELHIRHRKNGETDHQELWTGAMRETIYGGAISGASDRIYYFVLVGDGGEHGWSWRRDYFGCAAYIAGEAAEVMAGIRAGVRRRKAPWLAGQTAAAGLMAHELGHCFSYTGSKHLENLDGTWRNVMGPGYLSFPNCVLSDEQRESLLASPFIANRRTLLANPR